MRIIPSYYLVVYGNKNKNSQAKYDTVIFNVGTGVTEVLDVNFNNSQGDFCVFLLKMYFV